MALMHEVNAEWMEARKLCVCASEMKLLASCKEFNPKAKTSLADKCWEVWASKVSSRPVDTKSYNEAARGHICEPYAVEEYNACAPQNKVKMNHWDDILISRDGVGFSPDAMDIEVPKTWQPFLLQKNLPIQPKEILEIKCYNDAAQLKTFQSTFDKMKQDERWQVATAMYVCPSIEMAHLMYYDPAFADKAPQFVINIFDYSREDLKVEIDTVGKIIDAYRKEADNISKLGNTGVKAAPLFNEQSIIDDYYKQLEG